MFAKVEEREARLANYRESEERKLEAELAKIRKEKDDIDEKRRDFEAWKSNFVSLFLILVKFFSLIFCLKLLFFKDSNSPEKQILAAHEEKWVP